jgi:hypothetical protein
VQNIVSFKGNSNDQMPAANTTAVKAISVVIISASR